MRKRRKLTVGEQGKVRDMVDGMMASPRFKPKPYQGRDRKSQAFAIATSNVERKRGMM